MPSPLAAVLAILVAGAPPIPERDRRGLPNLRSESAVVRYADTGEEVLAKNADAVRPIASVTKLIGGLVLARASSAAVSRDEWVTITDEDKDRLKWSRSRLKVGWTFRWADLVSAALGASDNRAMYAAVRSSGLSRDEMADRMNHLAREIGM